MIVVHLFSLVLFLYVLFRFVASVPARRKTRIGLALAALLFSQYHAFTRLSSGGSLASPEMPYPVIVVLGTGYVLIFVLAVLLALRDVFLFILFLFRKRGFFAPAPFSPERRAFALAGVGTAIAAHSFYQSVRVPDVVTVDVPLRRLPKELDGFTLAQISDLHATALLHGPRVAAIVDAVNAFAPDAIVCTGDMVDGTPFKRMADVAPLRNLRARFGVFACEGNHEYYSGYEDWLRVFTDLGLGMLHNAHAVLDVNGKQLAIAGVNDPVAARFGKQGPDTAKALEGVPPDCPVVLLAHQPVFARSNARHAVDVQLSGHTHGGHAWGVDHVVASRNDGFVRGLYTVDAMKLYVSSGTGLWPGFPVRIGVPAEITRIVLRSAA